MSCVLMQQVAYNVRVTCNQALACITVFIAEQSYFHDCRNMVDSRLKQPEPSPAGGNTTMGLRRALHENVLETRDARRPAPCSLFYALLSCLLAFGVSRPRCQTRPQYAVETRDLRITRSMGLCMSPSIATGRSSSIVAGLPKTYPVRRYLRTCTHVTCGFTTAE